MAWPGVAWQGISTLARTLDEWIGATPDTKIPARVKYRVFERSEGKCAICGNLIVGRLCPAQCDHIKPLIAGGENRENNLQTLCTPCHKAKTSDDVAEKSEVYRVKSKHFGIKRRKGRPMFGTKASGFRKRFDGTVERR